MMIIAVVTFKIDKGLTDFVLKEKFLETSPIYKDTPGLIRKNYICDTSKNFSFKTLSFNSLSISKVTIAIIIINIPNYKFII